MEATKKRHVAKSATASGGSPVVLVRGLKRLPEIQLFVRAGGRCEFAGCNEYLLEHHLTLTPGNFAQAAHIVAFSRRGPRADAKMPAAYINDLSNLMLLCQRCHKLIDDHPKNHSVSWLKCNKTSHEERIRHLTGMNADLKTTVVSLTARIAGRAPTIPYAQIADAVDPRYPVDRKGVVVDLSRINTTGERLIDVGQEEIRKKIAQLCSVGLDGAAPEHISVFALAPIPLLVFLGRELSDKQQVDFFQRHRDTADWKWKQSGRDVEYAFSRLRTGSAQDRVALCLSLSGSIDAGSLPATIDQTFSVYELTLADGPPSPLFLRKKSDLENFRRAYMVALREIVSAHKGVSRLHLFPAAPAPIAIICGHALLPKVDPTLLVYDADKANGGFTLTTSVN
jgi:hypothetical protein